VLENGVKVILIFFSLSSISNIWHKRLFLE